ncbi:MAG: hypothetical protein JXR83_05505 [Deltaproteobacteria bacterium]|nr:hypothetical protein [Deltaproteobacteria bacterium]
MSDLGEQIQYLERLLAEGQIELALEGYEQLFAQLPTDEVLRKRVNFLRDSLHRHAPDWQVRTYVISPRAVAEAHIMAERYAEALEILEWLLETDPSDTGLARRVAMVRAMRNGSADVGIEPTASTSQMTPEMLVEAHLAGGDVSAALLLLKSLAHKRPHDQRLQNRLHGLEAAWGKEDGAHSPRVALTVDESTADELPAVAAVDAADDPAPAAFPPLEDEVEIPLEEQQTVARARALPSAKPEPEAFASPPAPAPPSPPPAMPEAVPSPRPPPLPPKRRARSVTDPKRDGYGILRSLLEDAEQALQQGQEQRVPTDKVRSAASPLPPERATSPGKRSARRRAAGDGSSPAVPSAGDPPQAVVRGRRRRKKIRRAHDVGSASDLVQGDPHQPLESKLLQTPLDSTASRDVELFDIHEALTAPDGRSLTSARPRPAPAEPAAAGPSEAAPAGPTPRPADFDDEATVHDEPRSEPAAVPAATVESRSRSRRSGRAADFAPPPPTNVLPGRRDSSRARAGGELVLPGTMNEGGGRSALGTAFSPPPPTAVLPGRRGEGSTTPAEAATGAGRQSEPAAAQAVPDLAPAAAPASDDLFDDDDEPTLLDENPLTATGTGERRKGE